MQRGLTLNKTNKVINTLETFYHCVNLPATAINSNGEILGQVGFSPYCKNVFIDNEILQKVKNSIISTESSKLDNDVIIISCSCNVSFAIESNSYLDKNYILYILGPYLNTPTGHDELSYKPKHCISHLFSLLHNISKEVILFSTYNKCCNVKKYHPYINRAIDYINKNFAEPLTIETLAQHLNINKCYFCSLFKKETGQTFSQYLNFIRVEKSKELLLNEENLSILDIAIAVGFNNQSYYNSIFKKLNDKTPLELRKLQI